MYFLILPYTYSELTARTMMIYKAKCNTVYDVCLYDDDVNIWPSVYIWCVYDDDDDDDVWMIYI